MKCASLLRSLERFQLLRFGLLAASMALMGGCGKEESKGRFVTVYTSLDRPHSSPIFQRFEEQTGIEVRAVYDTEASKTVGLFHRLLAERNRPQADVFWNSEVTRTIRLQEEGLLAPYQSPSADSIPVAFKDPDDHWSGFGLRSRVFLSHGPEAANSPDSFDALRSPEWRGRFTLANPLFGTTNTHFAALLERKGEAWLIQLCQDLVANEVAVATGNAQARDAVAAGQSDVCWTDIDDARGAIMNDRPVTLSYPDFAEKGSGVFLIPNTVALIKGSPNPETGEQFIDFLLSEEVEEMLAHSATAQIPVRDSVPRPDHVPRLAELHPADVDFGAISQAENLETVSRIVKSTLLK